MLHGVTQVSVSIKNAALRASDAFMGRDIVKWPVWRTQSDV